MRLNVVFSAICPQQDLRSKVCFGSSHLDLSKSDLVLRSLRSLMTSMEFLGHQGQVSEMSLLILADFLDQDLLEQLRLLIMRSPLNPKIVPLKDVNHIEFPEEISKLALNGYANYVYFTETGWIHAPSALKQMILAAEYGTKILGQSPVVIPSDTILKSLEPSKRLLFVSGEHYWSSTPIRSAPTLMTWDLLHEVQRRMDGIQELGSSQVQLGEPFRGCLGDYPCFSPMPGLAAHVVGEVSLPPFTTWQRWWDESRPHKSFLGAGILGSENPYFSVVNEVLKTQL